AQAEYLAASGRCVSPSLRKPGVVSAFQQPVLVRPAVRLRLDPGRRESLGWLAEHCHPCDLSASHLVEQCVAGLDLDAAPLSAPSLRRGHIDLPPKIAY